jgi:hypothetical protein
LSASPAGDEFATGSNTIAATKIAVMYLIIVISLS